MCDVPSTAVFCSESIECLPGTASKFFLKPLVTIPVAPIITGIVVHFRFVVSLHIKSCILTSFPLPFAQHFCLRVLPHQCACFLFFVFNYYIWPICCKFSVCVYYLISQHCDISLFKHWLRHVCVPFVCGFKWYTHMPKPVYEEGDVTVLWNQAVLLLLLLLLLFENLTLCQWLI